MTDIDNSGSSTLMLFDQALTTLKTLGQSARSGSGDQSSTSDFRRRVGELLSDFVDEVRSKVLPRLPEPVLRFLLDATYEFMREKPNGLNVDVRQIGAILEEFGILLDSFIMESFESLGVDHPKIFTTIPRRLGRLRDELKSAIKIDELDQKSATLDQKSATLSSELKQLSLEREQRDAAVKNWEALNAQSLQVMEQLQNSEAQSQLLSKQLELAQAQIDAATQKAADAEDRLAASEQRTDVLNEPKSKNVLVTHFESFKEGHQRQSSRFLKSGLAVLVFAMVAAIASASEVSLHNFNLVWQPRQDFNVPDLVWRVAIVTGSAGIGTYLLKQASFHRSLSVWADAIRVQLQTFDSYTALVGSDEQRDGLRAEFAKRVFGAEPTGGKSDLSETSLMGVSSLIDSLAKLNRTS